MTTTTMSRKRLRVTHRAIAEYWEYGAECRDNGDPHLHNDVGEPLCWACRGIESTEHDGRLDSYDYAAEWLNKAHLISFAAGGPDVPSNFALLCETCHAEMDSELGWGTNRSRTAAVEWIRAYAARFSRATLDALKETSPLTTAQFNDVLSWSYLQGEQGAENPWRAAFDAEWRDEPRSPAALAARYVRAIDRFADVAQV